MSLICDGNTFIPLMKGIKKIVMKGNVDFLVDENNLNACFITKGFLFSFNIPSKGTEMKFSVNISDPVFSRIEELKNGPIEISVAGKNVLIKDNNATIKIVGKNFDANNENALLYRKRIYSILEDEKTLSFSFNVESLFKKLNTMSRKSKIKFNKDQIRLYSSDMLTRVVDVGFEYEGGGEFLESFPVGNKKGFSVDLNLPFRYLFNFLDIFKNFNNNAKIRLSHIEFFKGNRKIPGYIMDISILSPVNLFDTNAKKSFIMCFMPDNYPIVY